MNRSSTDPKYPMCNVQCAMCNMCVLRNDSDCPLLIAHCSFWFVAPTHVKIFEVFPFHELSRTRQRLVNCNWRFAENPSRASLNLLLQVTSLKAFCITIAQNSRRPRGFFRRPRRADGPRPQHVARRRRDGTNEDLGGGGTLRAGVCV